MKFKVTRQDLKGEYTEPTDCPIARAIKRQLKISEDIVFGVTPRIVYINGKYYNLPREADIKARERSQSFKGWLLGGFTFEIKDL